MKSFLKIEHQSRADLVVDRITNSIINGELIDGELLPPENQLCEVFGVSRSILREAVRVLASKGLVEVKQGHGTFVRLPKIDIPEEAVRNYLMTNTFSLLQLMEVRSPIEVEAARLAAERREESHLLRMEESLRCMKDDSQTAETNADADDAFHRAIIDASQNPLFGIMIRSIMVNLHVSRQLSNRQLGMRGIIEEHSKILDAIKARKPLDAVDTMKEHLDKALGRIYEINALLKKGV